MRHRIMSNRASRKRDALSRIYSLNFIKSSMSIHRLSRMFALGNFAIATAILLSMAIILQTPETSFAQTTSTATSQTSGCVAPSFYSFQMTPASLNTPWNLPLLSTIDGPYTPTVTENRKASGREKGESAGGRRIH